MSLKAELDTWAAALKAYDEEDFDKSLELFSKIGDSSKILTNIGLIYATLGEHEAAVERFIEATALDGYLAVAYFQCGVSNFLLGRYELALKDFEEALLFLRGNQAINYEQLGLKFRLFSAEVLFNKGLAQIYLNRIDAGLADMRFAAQEKATAEHDVIDDAIADRGDGYTVFSIPVGVLYRPSEKKLKNSVAKDYLGKAVLIAASDRNDEFTTFTGATRLKQGVSPTGAYVDKDVSLSRSATEPAAMPSRDGPIVPRSALSRSQTTLNVAPDARARTGPSAYSPSSSSPSSASPGMTRAPTDPNVGRDNYNSSAAPSSSRSQSISRRPAFGAGGSGGNAPYQKLPPLDMLAISNNNRSPVVSPTSGARSAQPMAGGTRSAAPMRGLSTRRPSGDVNGGMRSAPAVGRGEGPSLVVKDLDNNRLTDFYDDYIDAYSSGTAPVLPTSRTNTPPTRALSPGGTHPNNSIAAWARSTPTGNPPRSAPVLSSYSNAPSSFTNNNNSGGGGSMRRKLTRRVAKTPTRGYEHEEEEGYGSGGDGYQYESSMRESEIYELVKIRVKLYYVEDVRGMAIVPEMPFDEFMERVSAKFGLPRGALAIKFKDEDGGRVSLQDDSDWELAIETARESSNGKPEGRLEMWCTPM